MNILDVMEAINQAQVKTQAIENDPEIVDAQAQVDAFLEEFLSEWYEPISKMMLKLAARKMAQLPEPVKMILKTKHPEQFARVEELAEGEEIT